MTAPIKLTIDETAPGAFVWTLLETDPEGAPRKVLRSADSPADSYEAALATGTRMLDAEIRRHHSEAAAHH